MMSKIRVNMLSSADKVAGQGVGSAYQELIALLRTQATEQITVLINSWQRADIIHCHTVDPLFLLRMKCRHGPTVAYVHFLPTTLDGSIKLPKLMFNFFKKYVTYFYKAADRLVVVNPAFIKELEKFGLDRKKITYIPNFVSREEFYPLSVGQKKALRRQYQLPERAFVVLGAGQVQTRKGVQDFVQVARENPNFKFIWSGGFSFGAMTDGYESLKKIVAAPPANVKFLGIVPRSQMNELYNLANVLLVPSYNELFPMTILEAAATHLPLVVRDLALYQDILLDDYLKGASNDDFSQLLKHLATEKIFYAQAQKKSQAISHSYTPERVLQLWLDFYKQLLMSSSN